jgi:hypothetical protein
MQSASVSAVNITSNLSSTSGKYTQYQDRIEEGSRKVKEIQRLERLDELKLKASFYFFLFTAIYLFLKRFYLHELIALAYWCLNELIGMSNSVLLYLHNILTRLLGIETDSSIFCIDADSAGKCWLAMRRAAV